MVDLREEELSACESDTDCELFGRGCCGSCGGDPTGWFALRKGEADPNPPVCDPIPPCAACMDAARPDAFCAYDKHCAVHEAPIVDGARSETCYSPWQALDSAYLPGAVGCDCYADGVGLCTSDSTG